MNLKQILAMLSIVATVCVISNTYAEDAALTLAQAQQLAIQHSRQLSAEDSAVDANREMAVSAAQLPDPVLKLGVDNLPVDKKDQFTIGRDFMTMRKIGISQEFTRSEKRQLRSQIYQDQAETARAQKSVTIVDIQKETALAWLDRYYAEALVASVGEQIDAVKQEIIAAESAYRSGRGTQAEVFSAHIVQASLEDRMSELDRRVHTSIINLARWIGDGADKPLVGKPDIFSISLDTGALDNELEHHPEIAVLTRQIKVAESQAQLAEANKKTDWSVEVAYAQRGPEFSDMLSFGVSIPLQWDQKNRQDREEASKLAMVEQIKAEREEMLRQHVGEIKAMVAEWKNGRERLTRYTQQILPLATERTHATLAAYQGGKASLTELLLARRNEIDIKQQAIQLEMDTAKVWAQLNFLIPEDDAATHQAIKDIQ